MILTGNAIREAVANREIVVDGMDPRHIGANSVDVRLAPTLLRIVDKELDFRRPYRVESIILPESGYVLLPHECYLGATVEQTITPYHVPHYEGRSTAGRYFLQSHMTAGFGDIGFAGNWTLEIIVQKPTRIYPFMRIGQIGFEVPFGRITNKYPGRYSNNHDPRPKVGEPNNF